MIPIFLWIYISVLLPHRIYPNTVFYCLLKYHNKGEKQTYTKPVKSPIQNWHIAHALRESHMAKTNIMGQENILAHSRGRLTPESFGQAYGSISYNREELKN